MSPAGFTAAGTHETSHGQEDVQTYALQAAERLRLSVQAAREVVACELLAVHQARLLAPGRPTGSERLSEAMRQVGDVLPAGTDDRPWGRDLAALRDLLDRGWPDDPEG